MSSISWSWKEYWAFFSQIDDEKRKTQAINNLDWKWLSRLPAEYQAEVMVYAPMEILQSLKHYPKIFKRDAILLIEHELSKKQKKLGKPKKERFWK